MTSLSSSPRKFLGSLSLILLVGIHPLFSQTHISGTVLNTDAQPVAFANVIALSMPDSIVTIGTTTDGQGMFTLRVAENDLVKISSIGYRDVYLSLVSGKTDYQIMLPQADFELDEVVVEGKKALYELEQDRVVMNVAASPSLSGNTALQVLQRAPGVIINRQNNSISLNAKGEVLVMINNKIQRIPSEVLLAKLEGMQAENIERVELIHQPPARYDASGAAGIIHIVLKENNSQGTSGRTSLTAGYGQREKAGVTLSLNSRHGIVNFYGDYTYNLNRADNYLVNHFRKYDYEGNDYRYENYLTLFDLESQQHSANAGVDIELGERTVVGALVSYSHVANPISSNSISRGFTNDSITNENDFLVSGENNMSAFISNLNFFHRLNDKSNINLDLDYVTIDFDNSGSVEDLLNPDGDEIQSDRQTPIDIWTVKLDNSNQLNPGTRLEFGAKATLSSITSSALVANLTDSEWIGNELFTGTDNIQENIFAAYGSYYQRFSPKLDGELGLRFEYFNYQLDASDPLKDFEQTFRNPFPIGRLNYKVDSLTTLQVSFNRTIVRPDFRSLSAYFVFIDPSILVFGNPQLRPTFTNTYKVSVQHRSMIFSVAYLRTINRLYYFNTVDKPNHIQTSSPSNLDLSNVFEATASIPFRINDWWSWNGFVSVLHQQVEATAGRPIPFTADITTLTAQLSTSFEWAGGWTANIDGQYMSEFLTGDQIQKIYPFLNLGIRKQFPAGSSLSLSFQDIANSVGKIDWDYNQPALGIRTFGNNDWSERQIRLTYSFAFGNKSLSGKRDRDTGSKEVRSRM